MRVYLSLPPCRERVAYAWFEWALKFEGVNPSGDAGRWVYGGSQGPGIGVGPMALADEVWLVGSSRLTETQVREAELACRMGLLVFDYSFLGETPNLRAA